VVCVRPRFEPGASRIHHLNQLSRLPCFAFGELSFDTGTVGLFVNTCIDRPFLFLTAHGFERNMRFFMCPKVKTININRFVCLHFFSLLRRCISYELALGRKSNLPVHMSHGAAEYKHSILLHLSLRLSNQKIQFCGTWPYFLIPIWNYFRIS
jgi:hypothetical protein